MKKHGMLTGIVLLTLFVAGIFGVACARNMDSKGLPQGALETTAAPITGLVTEPPHSVMFQEPEPQASSPSIQKKTEGESEHVSASFAACDMLPEQGSLRYWLYNPSDPAENMPLIVYLHGGSGKGDDLNRITAAAGFPQFLRDGLLGDVRAYVLIPQLPSEQKGWTDVQDAVYSLILSTAEQCGVDSANISLTGHSMGGTGTWSIAAAYPTLFARIAPLSGSVRNIADTAAKLEDTPIWAFVGSADTVVPPESSKELVARLRKSGGNTEITVFEGAGHTDVPILAYLDHSIHLLDWLTGQGA